MECRAIVVQMDSLLVSGETDLVLRRFFVFEFWSSIFRLVSLSEGIVQAEREERKSDRGRRRIWGVRRAVWIGLLMIFFIGGGVIGIVFEGVVVEGIVAEDNVGAGD